MANLDWRGYLLQHSGNRCFKIDPVDIQNIFEFMAKKSLEAVIKQYIQLGFEPDIIKIAYENVKGDADKVLEEIFNLQAISAQYPTKPANAQDQDAQLSKAIEMSISEAKDKKISLQPLNPEQRVRRAGVPVGLKNIGNTCYFNSLLQTYFQNVQFVRTVLSYHTPDKYRADKKASGAEEEVEFKRKQASCKLVEMLKILFCNMIGSDRKYMDPTEVITSIVDDYGNQIPIGDQKDIGEFNLIFLSRIDQGLQLAKKQHEMVMEGESESKKIDSPSKIAVIGDDHESRLSHRSSIKIQQHSIINQQFIGTMDNSYINEAHHIHQNEEQQFSLLFVNVRNKQLYKAIEEITIQHIDDYRNDKGEVVGVEKQSWIKKPPQTLFFQIDRVIFDKQSGQQKKINDEFDFPQTFYIDPFLLKNKDKALAVQKKVRKLRNQKEKYTNALKCFQKFGEKNLNLLDTLSSTIIFLKHQSEPMQSQEQLQNPTVFSNVSSKVKPELIGALRNYEQQVSKRIVQYEKKIGAIEQEIEQCYSSMRSTPYHLYSILIHEGRADSGHYYSYTYDIKAKIWRKYNDINISEESEAQVLTEARGLNFTSAYYLVYSQEGSLIPKDINQAALRNHQLSTSDKYLTDYYSTMIPVQLKAKISKENLQLYTEIQQYKMGGYANRVVQSYSKKFETCNESFRKSKWQKKKNTPPLLTNLPLYLKSLGLDSSYKSCLTYNAVQQYGPKEENPTFYQLLKAKMSNFNDFKKPNGSQFDQKYAITFVNNVYKAKAATKLFEALKKEEYRGVFGLIKQLKSGEPNQYFDWLTNLVGKILMVTFLAEAEASLERKQWDQVMERIRLMLVLANNFINKQEQKTLVNNCCVWATEISLSLPPELKLEVETITEMLLVEGKQSPYDQVLLSQNTNNLIEEIKSSTDIQDSLWNLSRSENIYIDSLLAAREEVKGKMEAANEIYKQMKKKSYPLTREEREQVIKRLNK